MKVQATLKNHRATPRKVRLLVPSAKGLPVQEALVQLGHSTKRAAKPLFKLIMSALANAENNFNLRGEDLCVSEIRVEEASRMKRWLPRAFGRATPIWKRNCTITVVLEDIQGKKVILPPTEKKMKKLVTSKKKDSVTRRSAPRQKGVIKKAAKVRKVQTIK